MARRQLGFTLLAAVMAALSSGYASGRAAEVHQNITPNTLATQRGCRDGGIGGINKTNPSWVSVDPSDQAKVVEGVVRVSKVTHEDFPKNHESHDWNFFVKLDPQYEFMNSDANDVENGERLMEMEWETAQFPDAFLPIVGDRVWMMGRWIFDCGHPPYRTEIHPPKAVAFTRLSPHIFSGDTAPSLTNKSFVYINGQGGYFYDRVGGQVYEFDIPVPPKPSPTAELRAEILSVPFGGIRPTVTVPAAGGVTLPGRIQTLSPIRPQILSGREVPRSAFGGQQTVRVRYDLTSVNDPGRWNLYQNPLSARPRGTPRFGAVIAAGWREPTLTKGYRVLRVTFDNVRIEEDHDTGSGEWRLWLHANGSWFRVSGVGDVDDGDTVQIGRSYLLTVPEDGELSLQSAGWESDPIDDNFGLGTPGSVSDLISFGNLDNNDRIGVFRARYTAANNFGIGSHDDRSERNGDEDTAGDFRVRYRIQEVQRIPPGTSNRPSVPGTGSQKRITVQFLSAEILDDADGALKGAGEIWFEIDVNGRRIRFPASGHRSIDSGKTMSVGVSTSLTIDQADTLRISVVGKEDDSPLGTDSLGQIIRNFDRTSNFGAGTHAALSNKSDGQFRIQFRITVQ